MLAAQATISIARPAAEILDWIADLDRYRRADTKITKVIRQTSDRVVFRGRLRGIPTPADENAIELIPGQSLTFVGAPRWTRRILDFRGSFECEPVDGGTRVTHREELGFKPWPIRMLAERWLREWMAEDIVEEMTRLRRLVEDEA